MVMRIARANWRRNGNQRAKNHSGMAAHGHLGERNQQHAGPSTALPRCDFVHDVRAPPFGQIRERLQHTVGAYIARQI
jgi:hypothetical protein